MAEKRDQGRAFESERIASTGQFPPFFVLANQAVDDGVVPAANPKIMRHLPRGQPLMHHRVWPCRPCVNGGQPDGLAGMILKDHPQCRVAPG